MFDWTDNIGEARQKELLRESQQYALVEQALAGREVRDPFYYDMLATLGRQLSAIGNQLQERYGCETVEPAIKQA